MSTADEQIRISSTVKHELERRKRGTESYNDVLERMLDQQDGDFYEGFGAFKGTDRGEAMRQIHKRGKRKSRERIHQMAESRNAE
jgi:predicted CopG family antitoxin